MRTGRLSAIADSAQSRASVIVTSWTLIPKIGTVRFLGSIVSKSAYPLTL